MRINFFEEFPEKNDLSIINKVNFPCTLFLGSKSIKEFRFHEKELKKINSDIEIAYWPILEKSHWISPFTETNELKGLFMDLETNKKEKKLKILLDLELPLITKNRHLFLRNFYKFRKNKNLIKEFFEKAEELNIEINTAEYPFFPKLLNLLGISYSDEYKHTKILMYYTSIIEKIVSEKRWHKTQSYLQKNIGQRNSNIKSKIQVGIGTIDTGIFENEPILSIDKLERDLDFLKDSNIDTAVIYSLNGLGKSDLGNDYLKCIKKFI